MCLRVNTALTVQQGTGVDGGFSSGERPDARCKREEIDAGLRHLWLGTARHHRSVNDENAAVAWLRCLSGAISAT